MEVLGWILAVAFAVTAAVLAFRKKDDPVLAAVQRLAREVRDGSVAPVRDDDPDEVASIRSALADAEAGESDGRDPGEEALKGLFRFVEGSVLHPLEAVVASGGAPDVRIANAVDALRDLAFYAERDRTEGDADEVRSENLPSVVQAVTREYTRESGVPVRFSGPPGSLPVRVGPERFKDALYLLLANAGHFGAGETIDVTTEADEIEVRLRVRDRGPGFSEEALERAFDPFWSSEPDAVGLGLTHARRLLEAQGARLRIGNVDGGGAEAVILLPRVR